MNSFLVIHGWTPIRKVMQKLSHYLILNEDYSVPQVQELFTSSNIPYAIVVDKHFRPIGYLEKTSFLSQNESSQAVDKLCCKDLIICEETDTLGTCFTKVEKVIRESGKCYPVLVVSTEGVLRGILPLEKLFILLLNETKQMYELFKAILDNIEEGIVAVDKNGRLAIFNQQWCSFHNVGPEVLGQNVKRLFPESHIMEALIQKKMVIRDEVLRFKKTGAAVKPRYFPLFDKEKM